MKNKKWIILIVAICCIALLGSIALFKGINGTLLAVVIGAICTIATGGAVKTWDKLQMKGPSNDIDKEQK